MNPVEPLAPSPAARVMTHLRRRKTAYASAASLIAGTAFGLKLNHHALQETIAFIGEKGLTDEFFNSEIHV